MGGFTRLLHSGQADDLMDEVPTFVARPLPNSVVEHEAYPVLNRPYAFLQWITVCHCARRGAAEVGPLDSAAASALTRACQELRLFQG